MPAPPAQLKNGEAAFRSKPLTHEVLDAAAARISTDFAAAFFSAHEQLPCGGCPVPSHVNNLPYIGSPRMRDDGGAPHRMALLTARDSPSRGEFGPPSYLPAPGCALFQVMS